MKYREVVEGTFIDRPNRFISHVNVDGKREVVHVKNTGRCKELLRTGCKVYLAVADNPQRKTKYDLIAVEKLRENKEALFINMDSQVVNDVAEEWLKKGELFSDKASIRREVKYGNSRFDFYVEDGERKAFIEAKGVTLEHEGVASFPDAPTQRGVKHVQELVSCMKDGYEAYILFIIQMKEIDVFRPNDKMHPEFGQALREAAALGVSILAVDCQIEADRITPDAYVKVDLEISTLKEDEKYD